MKINNSETVQALRSATQPQDPTELSPSFSNSVVPVIEINPERLRKTTYVATGGLINATSGSIYTTPTDRDFFMTGATIAYIKDATSTATLIRMQLSTDYNTNIQIFDIPCLTLTPQNGALSLSFNPPLKLKRGIIVAVTADTATANITVRGTIQGYIVEQRGS